jgi:DNA ligase-associated metallophosphoesterase
LSRTQRIWLAGLELIPDLSGALYVPAFRTLLIADLHLEKGSSLARRGVHLPPYDTLASLLQLEAAIAASRPDRLIFLGDSFHDGEARTRIDAGDLGRLRAITARVATIWICGNHDPRPPADIGGHVAEEVSLGTVTLRHAPQTLRDDEFEIAGHLHPAASLTQRGHSIRCKCFIGDERRVVMPAFGSFTGALGISAEPFTRLFTEGSYHVWMLGGRAVHRFPAKRVK